MAGIPTLAREPSKIVAGDSVKWTRSFGDYPAPTWVLSYELRSHQNTSGSPITITASQDGSTTGFSVSVAANISADWPPGTYHWAAYVTSGADRARVDRGIIEVEPDLAQAPAGFDPRSKAKMMLDAIAAMIAGKATKDQLSYTISGRSITKLSPEEVEKWRAIYEKEYARELKAMGFEDELRLGGKIRTRFV